MADNVTTWIGVAAAAISGIVSVATIYLRARTKERLAAIDRGTPEAARVVADAVTSFQLNTAGLTGPQTLALARQEIASRDRKNARLMFIFLAVTVVLAITTVVLAYMNRGRSGEVSEYPLCEDHYTAHPELTEYLHNPNTRFTGTCRDLHFSSCRTFDERKSSWDEFHAACEGASIYSVARADRTCCDSFAFKGDGFTGRSGYYCCY
jgi:hypothetical protein